MDFICPHKCSYRTSSGYCGSTGGWESCQYRQLHQPNTVVGYVSPLKKTNADRIRSMTDEELAETMLDCFAAFYDVEWSKQDILDWLKQEASE